MPLRSSAQTLGAICGNHMLDRADALVIELRVPDRYRADARQEAALAELEGEDPKRAVERYLRKEKTCGLTGDNTDMPKVVRSPSRIIADADPEQGLTRREEAKARSELGAKAWLRLTQREQEVVRLRAMGWTQAEIARELRVSQQRIGQLLATIAVKSAT